MMTYAEALEKLKKRGQEQLLRHYEDLSDAEKAHLLSDIESIDFSVFDRAEHFAKKEYRITPIPIFTAEMAEKTRKSCETAGISAIRAGKVAAVLLSGGQGTRLGFAHAKGMFDIGITRAHYIFEFHFAYLLFVAKRSGAFFPVYVMTSAMNRAEIRAFLEEHDFFGYDGRFVHFYAQSLVASTDTAGKILTLIKQYYNQQREIKHQEEVIAKLKSFNREKSIKRAESREKMLDKIERLEKPTEENTDIRI